MGSMGWLREHRGRLGFDGHGNASETHGHGNASGTQTTMKEFTKDR